VEVVERVPFTHLITSYFLVIWDLSHLIP